nr:site-specific integrase [uncultured Sediminibacterium sp.]
MAASSIITLDQRRSKKDGTFPVKLRISYKGKTRDFQTIYDLTVDDFRKLKASHPGKALREITCKLELLRAKAATICKQMRGFTFEKFEFELYGGEHCLKTKKKQAKPFTLLDSEFDVEPFKKRFTILTEVHPDKDHISYVYSEYIQNLLKQERIGSALNYLDSYNSLKKFGGNVKFEEVTVTWLVRYEKWSLNKGVSKTTIGIKLRSLRAIFNEAIFRKIIRKEDCYPFGRRLYMLPNSRNNKRSLTLQDVQKIFNYTTTDERVERARDFWLFCYLGNGMNTKDMLYLKYKNIEGEYLHFERAKTERSSRAKPILITVFISQELQAVIDKWGNPEKSPGSYLFPIMRDGLNMLERFDVANHFRTFINQGMRKVSKQLNLDRNVTNIVSRHTFSTIMKRSGASTEFIMEALGHTNVMTTENYLGSFENETKKAYAKNLTAFKDLPNN